MKATLLLASAALLAGTAFAQTGSPGNGAGGGTGSQAASDFAVPKMGVRSATGNDNKPSSQNQSANRDSMGAQSSAVQGTDTRAGSNMNSGASTSTMGAGASTTPSASSSNTLSSGSSSTPSASGSTSADTSSSSTMGAGSSSDTTGSSTSARGARADRN